MALRTCARRDLGRHYTLNVGVGQHRRLLRRVRSAPPLTQPAADRYPRGGPGRSPGGRRAASRSGPRPTRLDEDGRGAEVLFPTGVGRDVVPLGGEYRVDDDGFRSTAVA